MHDVVDIYRDKSLKSLVKILRDNPTQYEKVAKVSVDYEDVETLPDTAFAWPEKRAYAINGKDAAYLSALYRNQCPPELDGITVPSHVDENLQKAAYLYDFETPPLKTPTAVKVASLSSSDFLIPSLQKFPVRSKDEGFQMQSLLVKNAHIMGYDHLSEACNNLITKMASYGVSMDEVDSSIYKYAGLTQSNKELLLSAINRRLDFVSEDHKEGYTKLASIVGEMDFNRHNLVKIASTLEQLDNTSKVRHLYDKHLLNPMESVFNTSDVYQTKVASMRFSPERAAGVSGDTVKSLLGEDVYNEALVGDQLDPTRLAEVINSLPNDMVTDFLARA
jgi:hypothetical protein